MKILIMLVLLSFCLTLAGCDDWISSSGGKGNKKAAPPQDIPPSATPPKSSTPQQSVVEHARYHGLTNGGRPTWYFQKPMRAYPAQFTAVIRGCAEFTVHNNGHRYVSPGGYVVKQSEVVGRGMSIIPLHWNCQSSVAYIRY